MNTLIAGQETTIKVAVASVIKIVEKTYGDGLFGKNEFERQANFDHCVNNAQRSLQALEELAECSPAAIDYFIKTSTNMSEQETA